MNNIKPLNNKIYFELLPDLEQPQKTIFQPTADMMKLAKVIEVGNKVEVVNKGQEITLYVNNIIPLEGKKGFCIERDIIFIDTYPQPGKVHIDGQSNTPMASLESSSVIRSSSEGIEDGDIIYYKKGQAHVLPDNSEIISESQIFYK